MSKSESAVSRHKLKVRLLNVAIISILLLLLFKAQDSRSILPQMGISSQAIKMTLPAEHSLNTLQPGSIAPDFNCNGVGKQAARLRSLAGENLALVFANRDCPHCQAVLQELKHLCSSVRTQILVIMVDANQVGQEGDSCLRLVDATEQLFQAYGVVSVPTIYLLDAEQRVITVKSDFTDENPSKLAVELTSLLQQ